MSTDHHSLSSFISLTALLGTLFIFAIHPSTVVGYPSGGTVSSGSNPIESGGLQLAVSFLGESEIVLVTAPDEHDLVITDLIMQASTERMTCLERWDAKLVTDSSTKARFFLFTPFFLSSSYVTNTHHDAQVQLSSGIRVAAGQSIKMVVNRAKSDGSYCYDDRNAFLNITWSGYSAQP